MLSLEVRKKTGDGEVRRVSGPLVTIGASTGNQVVVRARGVAGRHARIVEKDGGFFLDVFRGVDPVFVNGRETQGCPVAIGDRITIGEASLTLLNGRPSARLTPVTGEAQNDDATSAAELAAHPTPPAGAVTPGPAPAGLTEAQYRGLRLELFRRLKHQQEPEAAAMDIARFLAQEIGPEEWAVGLLHSNGQFQLVASLFSGEFHFPQKITDDVRRAMGPLRVEDEGTPFVFIASPARAGDSRVVLAARELTRLPPRAAAFVEEAAQMADLAWSGVATPAQAEPEPPTLRPVPAPPPEVDLVAVSDAMRRVALDLPRLARSKAPVLILGEVGTGKDLVAAAIHRRSESAAGPYIVVDCSAMMRLEDEIFGRTTAGGRRHPGKLSEAAGGTLVLNEVGLLPQSAQARLFDALSLPDDPAHLRTRLIATSSSNLLPAVETGTIRRDLYFRLAVLTLRLPSLSERREDIPALFEHFVTIHAPQMPLPIEPDALNALLTYRYPGNARELENEVIRLTAVSAPGEVVTLERLDPKFRDAEAGVVLHEVDDLKKIVDSVEHQVIDRVMRKVEGNQSKGAELLNISRGSLIAKMSEYGIRDYRYLRRERKREAGPGDGAPVA